MWTATQAAEASAAADEAMAAALVEATQKFNTATALATSMVRASPHVGQGIDVIVNNEPLMGPLRHCRADTIQTWNNVLLQHYCTPFVDRAPFRGLDSDILVAVSLVFSSAAAHSGHEESSCSDANRTRHENGPHVSPPFLDSILRPHS